MLTTNQAASLLGVHPSSIKRWCNEEGLPCTYTPGGHRRIELDALLDFGRDRDLLSPLLNLKPHQRRAWTALQDALHDEQYDALTGLAYDLLVDEPASRFRAFLRFLRQQDLPLDVLFDHVLTPALQTVGRHWYEGELEIGDEHRITHLVRDTLIQLLNQEASLEPASSVALVGTSRNESHEIGALMTRLILEQHGWTVIYLGSDVPSEEFALQQRKYEAPLVCVSFTSLRGGTAEMQRLVQVLTKFYELDAPYRLALGGAFVSPNTNLSLPQNPLLDVEVFDRLHPFNEWVSSFSPDSSLS